MMHGRAETRAQKRALVDRLLAVWERCPALRLGQLIDSSMWTLQGARRDLFYVEDDQVAEMAEAFAASHGDEERGKP